MPINITVRGREGRVYIGISGRRVIITRNANVDVKTKSRVSVELSERLCG